MGRVLHTRSSCAACSWVPIEYRLFSVSQPVCGSTAFGMAAHAARNTEMSMANARRRRQPAHSRWHGGRSKKFSVSLEMFHKTHTTDRTRRGRWPQRNPRRRRVGRSHLLAARQVCARISLTSSSARCERLWVWLSTCLPRPWRNSRRIWVNSRAIGRSFSPSSWARSVLPWP